jgi:hypothetical protein
VQIPIFISAVWAIRHMALSDWPGMAQGGLLWFPDLTLPALTFGPAGTPMGMWGAILPALVTLLIQLNIRTSFGNLRRVRAGDRTWPWAAPVVSPGLLRHPQRSL